MRLGDTDHAIARGGLMGRREAAQLRRTAEAACWLDVAKGLRSEGELLPCTWVRYAHRPRWSRWRNRIASGSRVGGVKASRAPPSTAPWCAATASPARTPRCATSSQASRSLTRKWPPCWSSTPVRRRRSTSAMVPRSSTLRQRRHPRWPRVRPEYDRVLQRRRGEADAHAGALRDRRRLVA